MVLGREEVEERVEARREERDEASMPWEWTTMILRWPWWEWEPKVERVEESCWRKVRKRERREDG